MFAASELYKDEMVIDDDNFGGHVPADIEAFGHIPRDYVAEPYGSALPAYETLGLPDIDRSEYDDRIEEMEKTKSRLSDMYLRRGWPKPYQNGIPYCWIYAVASAMLLDRAKQNLPLLNLSPESAGARLTGFRSVGGWSSQGAKWVAEHGMNTYDEWPKHAAGINRKYDTAENREKALDNKILFADLPARSFKALMNCLFARLPCPIGLNWWRHAICAADPVKLGKNAYGARILNSHGDGFLVLSESKATPDDALCLYDVNVNVGKV